MRARTRGAPWIVVLVLPLLAGCSTHYVDIYVAQIGQNCECTADMGQDPIENIFAHPGDVIVWVNTTSGDMDVRPGLAGLFEADTYTVPAGGRVMTKVVASEKGNFPVQLTCHDSGGVAGPTVVVGDPP